ncbi:hypothetical protein GCM10027403_09560 [Arthrobacter tecti]
MTRIVVSRSGGFAGITRTWSVEVSSDEAQERWLPLLDQVEHTNDDAQRDRYVYRISVGYREVTVTESAVQGPWKELVERAKDESAAGPQGGSSRDDE